MPPTYLEFLEKFSPYRLTCTPIGEESDDLILSIWGASELEEGQLGYSVHFPSGTDIEDWPTNLLVIGQSGGDPWVIDLVGNRKEVPVFFAEHGMGEWEFVERFSSLEDFIDHLQPILPDWQGFLPNSVVRQI